MVDNSESFVCLKMTAKNETSHSKEFYDKLNELVTENNAMDKRTMTTRSMTKRADEHAKQFGERPIWQVDKWIEEHVHRKIRHEFKVEKSGKYCGCELCYHKCSLCTCESWEKWKKDNPDAN